jgi:hypothetical protein
MTSRTLLPGASELLPTIVATQPRHGCRCNASAARLAASRRRLQQLQNGAVAIRARGLRSSHTCGVWTGIGVLKAEWPRAMDLKVTSIACVCRQVWLAHATCEGLCMCMSHLLYYGVHCATLRSLSLAGQDWSHGAFWAYDSGQIMASFCALSYLSLQNAPSQIVLAKLCLTMLLLDFLQACCGAT